MADLIAAARKQIEYATNEVGGRFPKVQTHLDKADAFLDRAQSATKTLATVAASLTAVEPLSRDPRVALAQILAACGFDSTQTNDPLAVLDKASPDQNRQLALLGFFGQPSQPVPGADYSLFERYYKETPVGLTPDGQPTEGNWIAINETVAQDGAWQTYMAGDR